MRLKFGKRRAADDGIEVTEERGLRTLHLGSSAIQSAMRVSRPWDLELAYTRAMMGFSDVQSHAAGRADDWPGRRLARQVHPQAAARRHA